MALPWKRSVDFFSTDLQTEAEDDLTLETLWHPAIFSGPWRSGDLLDPSICSSQLIRRFLGRQLIRRFLRYPWMYIFIFLDWGFSSSSYTLTFAHVLVWPCIFVTSAFEGVCCMYSMVCFDFSLQDFILSCQWPGVLSCCGCVDIKAGIRGCDHEGKKAIVTMMCCLVL